MISITFNTTFVISEGSTLAAAFVNGTQLVMQQSTPEARMIRADWKTFFTSRAHRSFTFTLEVTRPPEATLHAAKLVQHTLPASLPKGGPLAFTIGEDVVTYTSAKVIDCRVQNVGLTNHITYTFEAVNPDVSEEARQQFETGEIQEFEPGSFD